MPRSFDIVVAVDAASGIGKGGELPWKIPGDMAYFKELTTKTQDARKRNALIMGRKTWESIPPRFRPLKGRLNIVVSKQSNYQVPPDVVVSDSLERALESADREDIETVFLIGGGTLYAESLKSPHLRRIYLTNIRQTFECDTFFPSVEEFECVSESTPTADGFIEYTFTILERKGVSGGITQSAQAGSST